MGFGGDIWFALGEERPTAFFAGIWVSQWVPVRRIKAGLETINVFGLLTTKANAGVFPIHETAMPVILTMPEECRTWMTAPCEGARALRGRFLMARSISSHAE